MKDELFNITAHKTRVLIAPLDWGLGHATRCIPIISKLIQQNCEVFVAAGGSGKILLQKEFPRLNFIELQGYRVKYSRSKIWLPVKLLLQIPKLLYRVYAENRWLKNTVNALQIEAVISDNRLGLSHKKIPCVYITHQLQIKTGSRLTESIVQKIHYHFINKYTTCWVPDAAGTNNLAGILSHPAFLPKTPVIYIGPLSRFEKKEMAFTYELCIILSGPEPQRTLFEKLILKDLHKVPGKKILVRGLPYNKAGNVLNNESIEIRDHLPAAELNTVIQQSKLIISRSGYTTVMDLVKLQKKAVFVPTPGQTEQEYLAGYLQQKQVFLSLPQQHFSIEAAIQKVAASTCNNMDISQTDYEKPIELFIDGLLKKDQ